MRCARLLGIASLVCLLAASTADAALIDVYFEPTETEVTPEETFTVSLLADIPLTLSVLGWGLDVEYDTSVLSLDGVTIGPSWIPAPPAPNLDGDELAGLAFPLPISGLGILLANLDFSGSSAGATTLTIGATLGDFTEGFALGPPAFPGSFADFEGQSAVVGVVPEPATLALFGIGAGALCLLQARRRRGK